MDRAYTVTIRITLSIQQLSQWWTFLPMKCGHIYRLVWFSVDLTSVDVFSQWTNLPWTFFPWTFFPWPFFPWTFFPIFRRKIVTAVLFLVFYLQHYSWHRVILYAKIQEYHTLNSYCQSLMNR